MRLTIRSLHVKLTDTVREAIEKQLQYALARFEPRIALIEFTSWDNNGPRGGRDQACRVQVHLNNGNEVMVSEVQDNLLAAVSNAADRVAQAVSRTLKRKRNFAHVRMA